MIYNIVLVSAIQQSEFIIYIYIYTHTHTHIYSLSFRFYSHNRITDVENKFMVIREESGRKG